MPMMQDFESVDPNRSALTDRGRVEEVEATWGKRLNVIAAMLSTGEVLGAKLWQPAKAEAFAGFPSMLVDKVKGRPLTVILDNASVHKSKESQPLWSYSNQRG